jgi:aryl-alcohol dehydrogenase-like predicted oxidoreductase
MAQFALRWILMEEAVSVVIPGAKNRDQATSNAAASRVAAMPSEVMDKVRALYRDKIAPHVHQRW